MHSLSHPIYKRGTGDEERLVSVRLPSFECRGSGVGGLNSDHIKILPGLQDPARRLIFPRRLPGPSPGGPLPPPPHAGFPGGLIGRLRPGFGPACEVLHSPWYLLRARDSVRSPGARQAPCSARPGLPLPSVCQAGSLSRGISLFHASYFPLAP